MKINTQGIKDNAKHVAGTLVGLFICKPTGLRYSKDQRETKWYSTAAANLAADGFVQWTPYKVFLK